MAALASGVLPHIIGGWDERQITARHAGTDGAENLVRNGLLPGGQVSCGDPLAALLSDQDVSSPILALRTSVTSTIVISMQTRPITGTRCPPINTCPRFESNRFVPVCIPDR